MTDELKTLVEIGNRASEIAKGQGHDIAPMTFMMDVENAHKDIPMDLEALLKADKFNFTHDVFGIGNHMNRETGHLEGCFVPRFALPMEASEVLSTAGPEWHQNDHLKD